MRLPSILLPCLCLLLADKLALADSTQPRDPVPTSSALKNAAVVVNTTFRTDIAAAKSPDEKAAVARKILAAAKGEKGASRYVLLATARDLAVDAGDVQACDAALDDLETSFDVDSAKLRLEPYGKIAHKIHSPADGMILCNDLSAAARVGIAADRFDVAKSLADLGLRTARSAGDPALVKQATADVATVGETATAFGVTKKALVILQEKPRDPDANLQVGKYRCLLKGDWQIGLPMLAMGSDPMFKALAAQEIAGVTLSDDEVKLADAWWDIAQKQPGLGKQRACAHARTWYQRAIPNLVGLAKAKVEKRVEDIDQLANDTHRVVNLLSLVDVRRDAVNGAWKMEHGALVSDGSSFCRIQFPYQPSEEYDFRIVFTRVKGANNVNQSCVAGGNPFEWVIDGWAKGICAFEVIDGRGGEQNPTTTRAAKSLNNGRWLNNGQEYTSVIKVRKTGIEADLDGKLITAWNTDFSDLNINPVWALRRNDVIGVGSWESPTVFRTVEVIEVTGEGKIVKQGDSGAR